MTVSTLTVRASYAGNGVAYSFPFPFKVLEASHLKVTRLTPAGIGSVLVRDLDYTLPLTAIGADAGGSITLIDGDGAPAPLATGYTLLLERELPLTQPLSLRGQGGAYSPESLEAEFDRFAMQLQQLDDVIRNQGDPTTWVPARYTSSTRPTPSALWAGVSIRVKDPALAEQEQSCLQQADGSWAWITKTDSRPIFWIEDFGATGGVDDAAPIQATLDAANAAGGGRVRLLPATSGLKYGLTYGSNTTIEGFGQQSRLEVWDGGTATFCVLAPKAAGVHDVTMRDFAVDHGSDHWAYSGSAQCISANETTRCTLENVVFSNVMTMAVWTDSNGHDATHQLVIRHCAVLNSEGGGFSVFGNIDDVEIANNFLSNCKDDAIALQDIASGDFPDRAVISNNRIRTCDVRNGLGSTPHAILSFGAFDVEITGNVIDKTVAGGIMVQDGANRNTRRVVVTGNSVYRAGITGSSTAGVPGEGIYVLTQAGDLTVSGNQVYGSRGAGINVKGRGTPIVAAKHVAINGNTSSGNGSSGLRVDSVADFSLTGNVCMNNGTSGSEPYGILLIDQDGTMVHGLVVGNRAGDDQGTKTQTYGVYLSGTSMGSVLITANALGGNATAAISSSVYWPAAVTIGQNTGDTQIFGSWIGPNASSAVYRTATELVAIAAAPATYTDSTATLLPANSLIETVVSHTVVAPPGISNYAVGDDRPSASRFGSGISGTSAVCLDHWGSSGDDSPRQKTGRKIRITPNTPASDGTGRIRVVVLYRQFTAPTS